MHNIGENVVRIEAQALKDLADAGIVRRGPGDSWLLASRSRERLAPDADARAAR